MSTLFDCNNQIAYEGREYEWLTIQSRFLSTVEALCYYDSHNMAMTDCIADFILTYNVMTAQMPSDSNVIAPELTLNPKLEDASGDSWFMVDHRHPIVPMQSERSSMDSQDDCALL